MSDENSGPSVPHEGARASLRVPELILNCIVALCVFGLIALTFVDVVGRYLLNLPVPGGFELIEIILALAVFSALPLATIRNEHITVGIFEPFFRGRLRHIQRVVVLTATAAMLAFVADTMWSQAVIYDAGSTKTLSLRLPIAPVVYAVALFSFLAFLAAVYALIQYVRRLR